MKFKNLLFSIILVNEYFSVSICINIKNANHINLTFNEYPITNNIPIDIPNTLEPVSPIIAFAFKSWLNYSITFGNINSKRFLVYSPNVNNNTIDITKYPFIALPGLKSNRFIKFVDKAIINVFITMS